jgi:hypothetical protein
MPRTRATRKRLFRAALGNAGLTARQWAETQGLTSGHLSNLLSGTRENPEITQKVDQFIDKQLISLSKLVA